MRPRTRSAEIIKSEILPALLSAEASRHAAERFEEMDEEYRLKRIELDNVVYRTMVECHTGPGEPDES